LFLRLPTRFKLKDHLEAKHTKGGPKCQICIEENQSSPSFANGFRLKVHLARFHGGEWPHKCPVCGKGFDSTQKINDHLRVNHSQEQLVDSLQCEICGMQFVSSVRLLSHRRRDHENDKGFECGQCGKYLCTRGKLNVHVKTRHNGENLHECYFCSKGFRSKKAYFAHLRKHTNE